MRLRTVSYVCAFTTCSSTRRRGCWTRSCGTSRTPTATRAPSWAHHIEANSGRLARRSRQVPLLTKGKRHDLLQIFEDVNERYFDGAVNALITWGTAANAGGRRANPRRTIKLGSYGSVDRLIRVHPSLDRTWVPRYFVAFVVYHEMLHHVMPGHSRRGPSEPSPAGVRRAGARVPPLRASERMEKAHICRGSSAAKPPVAPSPACLRRSRGPP